ncbi:MAG TPA: hypothetical protein PKW08_04120 [Flavobacteriaceae bacterium]|nr:hypothetical protein [Flavobacteriaceae bacterium]MCB9213413.1 hypothetical protein [Alteromonas sp.]HPF10307.1 hypothetical protein [Flavobacteriaceae bacterium]HQU20753.1 hypothetical protein [Flavobacteriaceae bacterium]HQU64829.1 hypothetical protein [Flavobacteriaceae bacterium]
MNNPPGKNTGIIAYLTFIGLLIAFTMNLDKKQEFATWHIRNMFGLLVLLFVSIVIPSPQIGFYVYLLAAGCWLWSFTMALMGKKEGIPWLSEKFQTWFRFLG